MTNPKGPEYGYTRNWYIHGAVYRFYEKFMDWLSVLFYDEFQYKIVATYDKAVQTFEQRRVSANRKCNDECNRVDIKPSITLDPISGEFAPAPETDFHWRYQHLFPQWVPKIQDAIYRDDECEVYVCRNRYEGTFEVMFWLGSGFEATDYKINLMQHCNGFNRYIRPTFVGCDIDIPECVAQYVYENFYRPEKNKVLDLSGVGVNYGLYKSLNTNKYLFPYEMTPRVRLTSISDASEVYGSDNFADWKLTATFSYEIELPVYYTIYADWKLDSPKMKIGMGYSQRAFDYFIPNNIMVICDRDFILSKKASWIVSGTSPGSTTNQVIIPLVDMPIDEEGTNIILVDKDGELNYGNEYLFGSPETEVIITKEYNYEDEIFLFYYKPMYKEDITSP